MKAHWGSDDHCERTSSLDEEDDISYEVAITCAPIGEYDDDEAQADLFEMMFVLQQQMQNLAPLASPCDSELQSKSKQIYFRPRV